MPSLVSPSDKNGVLQAPEIARVRPGLSPIPAFPKGEGENSIDLKVSPWGDLEGLTAPTVQNLCR